jgi:hypothetical protein
LEKGVGVFGPCWTDKVLGEFLASALVPRSDAANAVASSLKPLGSDNEQRIARTVFNGRWRANINNSKKAGGFTRGRVDVEGNALQSHVDPTRGVRIRSKL